MSDAESDRRGEFEAAGLYDPDVPDADQQLEVLEYLWAQGLSTVELAQADAEQRLLSAGAFALLREEGPRLTIAAAAAGAGLDEATAIRFWRACGFIDTRRFERRFSESDVELFRLFATIAEFTDTELALHYARTLGESIAQIAEAEIALVRANIEAPLIDEQRWAEIARAYVAFVTEVFQRVSTGIDTLHRHHLDVIGRRYGESNIAPSAANVVDLVIGFADLAGYTGISQSLDSGELVRLLDAFESITGDVISSSGASVVKRIGDGVMFMTNAPGLGCDLTLNLLDRIGREPRLPRLRVGVAFGEVIVRQGDFYGPVVNLAARLVSEASPGVAFVSEAVAERASVDPHYVFVPAGRLQLPGFTERVPVFQLLRS